MSGIPSISSTRLFRISLAMASVTKLNRVPREETNCSRNGEEAAYNDEWYLIANYDDIQNELGAPIERQ